MRREGSKDARLVARAGCAIDRIERREAGSMVLVAAHPDDETIGAGATLAYLVASGWRVEVLHVTDGAPRDVALRPALRDLSIEEAARVRREEVRAAIRAGRLEKGAGVMLAPSLAVADQEAARVMAPLARTLAARLAAASVDVVVTHPYEGGHPDHDAVAFAVHAAVALTSRTMGDPPRIVEMSSYHRRDGALVNGAFLPSMDVRCERVRDGRLDDVARARKRAMLDAFTSQRDVLAAFDTLAEPLRCAPYYDFTRPPHAGVLHYETLPFAWTGDDWRELASDALRQLGLTATALMQRPGCSSGAAHD